MSLAEVRETIHVNIRQHKKTGLLIAVSDEMPGLLASAPDKETLLARIPKLIAALLEAEGKEGVLVRHVEDDLEQAGFESNSAIYAMEVAA